MENRFTVGEVLNKSFTVFFANFTTFAAIAIMVYLPIKMVVFFLESDACNTGVKLLGVGISFISIFIENYIVTGAIVYGVFMQMKGTPFHINDCVKVAINRFWPLLGASVIVGLLTVIGMVCLVIPGIIVAIMYSVVVPVIVVEKAAIREAMSRSSELTSGKRFAIFLASVIVLSIAFIIGIFGGLAGDILAHSSKLATAAVSGIIEGIAGAFGAVLTVVMYYLLRTEKEDIGFDEIVEVFS